ncbi:DNA repair protein RadA [Flavobacteriaceae bacterium]|nr:DNA repair protein RadA [Flavobacteriaceae bacterium]
MAKIKTSYFCQNCGTQHSGWMGQCNACKEWNTIVEERVEKETIKIGKTSLKSKPLKISEVTLDANQRFHTPITEFNTVLGGGIVPGSVMLLGGEPGIGKSTLSLQLALELNKKVLYVSGEESLSQIKMRAERIKPGVDQCYLYNETDSQLIIETAKDLNPEVLIIDSIQTLHSPFVESSAGSISQIREASSELISYAKQQGIPIIIIGHINKEGHIAGPKILEHMVDVVLQFEGDRHHNYRILRAKKNRFGSTHELGVFEMLQDGLREVSNPSEILLNNGTNNLSGTAISATLEGMRTMMVEIQALVSTAVYGTPQRSTTGFNVKRLNMLLAVLEKRLKFKLGIKDVFLNLTGGIKLEDPAIDLAVVAAVLSSDLDIEIPQEYCFCGEVGLSGEIRAVSKLSQRISEAEKLGFEKIFIASKQNIQNKHKIKVVELEKIEDLIKSVFV